tara:strand:- start:121 stop:630 length:510 start_codon:yes stop_codon:yes gene_type:complete
VNKTDALKVLMTAQKGFINKTVDEVGVPFLTGVSLPIRFFAEEIDLDLAADAIARFSRTSPSSRNLIQDHLFRAAQQSFEDCSCDFDSPQDQLDWESESTGRFNAAKVPTTSSEIWSLVKFNAIHIAPGGSAMHGQYVLKVSGECAWDGEHGVAVTFAGDGRLVGVGEA